MLNIKCNAAAIAAMTVALSLSATSLALAQEGGEQTAAATIALKQHATKYKTYNAAQDPTSVSRRTYGQPPKAAPASHSPFTLPQEDPDFHGDNGG
jgi:hypothetical protein